MIEATINMNDYQPEDYSCLCLHDSSGEHRDRWYSLRDLEHSPVEFIFLGNTEVKQLAEKMLVAMSDYCGHLCYTEDWTCPHYEEGCELIAQAEEILGTDNAQA